jgi:hypothetical protein
VALSSRLWPYNQDTPIDLLLKMRRMYKALRILDISLFVSFCILPFCCCAIVAGRCCIYVCHPAQRNPGRCVLTLRFDASEAQFPHPGKPRMVCPRSNKIVD